MSSSPVTDRTHRLVQRFLEESRLDLTKTFLVAVSGGPDSLTLLYSLHELRTVLKLHLHGAHLNHGLRGQHSDEDANFVKDTFEDMNIPATVGYVNVLSVKDKYHLSLEEAARKARYEFFYETAQSVKASYVLLGHTADDQAETVLLNLLRGTGITGLRGMVPVKSWRPNRKAAPITLVRPLLTVTRDETEAYCKAMGLRPRQDESNLSPEFTRNRLRSQLMPAMKTFNPSIRTALLNMSRSLYKDLSYIEESVQEAWEKVTLLKDSKLRIDRAAFSKLPASLQHHLLRRAIAQVRGDLGEISLRHIEDMARLTVEKTGKRLSLPGNLTYSVGYKDAVLAIEEYPELHPQLQHILEQELPVPGEIDVSVWRVTAAVTRPPKTLPPANGLTAYLDLNSIGNTLVVRGRKAGDTFWPLGTPQEKKLQDFMTDAKIPREDRDAIPLVVSKRGIAWVVGHRIAEWAKLQKDSEEAVVLEFKQLDETLYNP